MLNVQVTAYRRQTVPDWPGHVTHYKILGLNHITLTAEPKVVKFCTRVGSINSMQQDDISPTKGRGYGHVTVFKILPLVVMQRDTRVCQWQLSYLYDRPLTEISVMVSFCVEFADKILIFAVLKLRLLQRRETEASFYLCNAMLVRYLPSSCVRPSIGLSRVSVLLRRINLGLRKECHAIAQGL